MQGFPTKRGCKTTSNHAITCKVTLGGRLFAVSAINGKKLAEYKLNAAPVWDGIAIANGQVYISLADGTVQCLGQ
ncbi:MAG: PQQ-binding-like beta-propeller repeat protein [Planctomycetes bacterium]|nr:PQQ-binding-like beta-propeller repeat protein [Planctomycetota bacterium]